MGNIDFSHCSNIGIYTVTGIGVSVIEIFTALHTNNVTAARF